MFEEKLCRLFKDTKVTFIKILSPSYNNLNIIF